MVPQRPVRLLAAFILLIMAALSARTVQAAGGPAQGPPPLPTLTPNETVYASGLDNPRGLKFGPDGNLYVAEGGTGGSDSTTKDQCVQVPEPVGHYKGSKTGAHISKITSDGVRTIFANNFPSSQNSVQVGGFVSGVGDIAFVGDTLYAVLAGAGCSHGVPDVPNAIIKVNGDGTWTQVADLGAFLKANPVKNPNPADFEPDATWYSLLAVGGDLYAIEPNHGELDKITTDGKISRLVDISDSQGHSVPTAMALGPDGNFYVGNLGIFPANPHEKILKITPSGQVSAVATGLTAVLGVAFDTQGRLYALETSAPSTTDVTFVIPGSGRVVLVKNDGTLEPIATGLTFPTAMTFGPDGALYVSNMGFGFPPGQGQIVRITLPVASKGATNGQLLIVVLAVVVLVLGGWVLSKRMRRSQ